jgi:hypothetical protein
LTRPRRLSGGRIDLAASAAKEAGLPSKERRMRTTVLMGLVWVLALPNGLTAQTDPQLEPGSRIRLSLPRDSSGAVVRRVGRLLAVRQDSLFLEEAGRKDSTLVLWPQVSRIEVSRSRRGHTLRGMGIGLLVGAAGGAAVGLAAGDDPPGLISFSAGDKAALGGVAFGVLGSLIGAIAGSVPSDSWVDVPVRRVNVALFPARFGGAGLGVTLRF